MPPASSSSSNDSTAFVTGRSEVPATVTTSSRSTIMSSSGVTVNVAVPSGALAGITISKSGTGAKSTARGSPLAVTVTATRVGDGRTPLSTAAATVTSTGPPPSDACAGFTVRNSRMRVDTSSSSARATDADVTGRSDTPDTARVSSDSTFLSSSGLSTNVPEPLAAFAGIVIRKSPTGSKSTVSGSPPPATDTVTAVAVWRRP